MPRKNFSTEIFFVVQSGRNTKKLTIYNKNESKHHMRRVRRSGKLKTALSLLYDSDVRETAETVMPFCCKYAPVQRFRKQLQS